MRVRSRLSELATSRWITISRKSKTMVMVVCLCHGITVNLCRQIDKDLLSEFAFELLIRLLFLG